jgi:hypothetical protein
MFKVGVKNKYIKYLRMEEVYFKGGSMARGIYFKA